MRTTDIIVVYFQLGLGVDSGVGTKADVLVAQISVTVTRTRVDVNSTVKGAFAPICDDVVKGLLTCGVGAEMLHGHLLVEVTALWCHSSPTKVCVGAVTAQLNLYILSP